jgi:hypothetical protein
MPNYLCFSGILDIKYGGVAMRSLALLLVLAIALGPAYAYPLQGGDENVKCTLFGTHRMPLAVNSTEEILKLDVGLIGVANASYELVDSKDKVFVPIEYRNLQIGRQELIFQVPIDDLFKLLKVAPTEGKPFDIKWWMTPKGIRKDMTLRYYGIEDWMIDSDLQALTLELSITNEGTAGLPIGPENFSLLDQWGWEYYPVGGFQSTILEPKMTLPRVKLGFTGLSSLSRPTILAYNYQTDDQIILDLEKDAGPLSDSLAFGTESPQSQEAPAKESVATPSAPAKVSEKMVNAVEEQPQAAVVRSQNTSSTGSSLKEQIEASKLSTSSVGKDLDSGIEEAKKRLDAIKKGPKSN